VKLLLATGLTIKRYYIRFDEPLTPNDISQAFYFFLKRSLDSICIANHILPKLHPS